MSFFQVSTSPRSFSFLTESIVILGGYNGSQSTIDNPKGSGP